LFPRERKAGDPNRRHCCIFRMSVNGAHGILGFFACMPCVFYLCRSHCALDLFNPFQEQGLYELGDGTVALKCHRKFEKEAYVDMDPHVDALKCLREVCCAIPVHTVWGERKNCVYGLDIIVKNFC